MKHLLTILTTLLVAHALPGAAPTALMDTPGRLLKADAAQVASDGWVHFYNAKYGVLLLSIHPQGQDIGRVEEMLSISSGLLANYGKGANDLSGADYIDNGIWLTMNRYWRIDNANAINKPVRIRFYFNDQDFRDLQGGVNQTGRELGAVEQVQFFLLEGGSVHPFATRTKNARAAFRVQQAQIGEWEGHFYAEYQTSTLSCSGSGGFLIPLDGQAYAISGKITDPEGHPVEDVYIESVVAGASVRTTTEGEYTLANLKAGVDYVVKPFSQDKPTRQMTVLDLIRLHKYLEGNHRFLTAYDTLAADADKNGLVDFNDMVLFKELILGVQPNFPDEQPWFFLPGGEKRVDNLARDVEGINFTAVKIGDLWQESDFPNEPPSMVDPYFHLEDVSSCGGGEVVRFELKVDGFEGVLGFQFTLEWDPTVMQFDNLGGFALPYLDKTNFGLTQVDEGKITIAWYTPDPPGSIKLKKGQAICHFLFKAVGDNRSFTTLNFSEEPTPMQILRDNLSPGNALFTVGSARIESNTTLYLQEVLVKPVSCFTGHDGAVDITPGGGTPPYSFKWSNGSTEEDLRDLPAGTYRVTVYDSGDCPFFAPPAVVGEPDVLYFTGHNIRQIRCPGTNDGAISFKVQGGREPYLFAWSNGAITPWIGQLSQGTYAVTVTDANGCSKTEEFEIMPPQEVRMNYSVTHSANGKGEGEIFVRDMTGCQPPQSYGWNNGQEGPRAVKLRPGAYSVIITDAVGCQYPFAFRVEEKPAPTALEARLESDRVEEQSPILLQVESPLVQTAQLKIFDGRSKQAYHQVLELSKGDNFLYIPAPGQAGEYLMQILASGGEVSSLRLKVE